MSDANGTVVVAVDGTDRSAGAIKYAVEEARARTTGLTVVHVSPTVRSGGPMIEYLPALIEAEGKKVLESVRALVESDAPGLTVTTILKQGSRTGGILDAAAGAAVLVLGRESRTGMERLLTGSTTGKVTAGAKGPVVVVPSTWEPGLTTGRIVVGIKSETYDAGLVSQAFEMAAARHATLTVVHAWKLPDPYIDAIEDRTHGEEWVAEGHEFLDRVLAEWRRSYPDVQVETQVKHLDAVAALVDAGQHSDLLLLARRTPTLLHPGHLGWTAHAVLQRAPCPVEVLPATTMPAATPGLTLEEAGRLLR